MMSTFLDTDWVRALASADMMAVEHVLSDIYAARCEDLSDFALFDGGAHKGFHTIRMGRLKGCSAIYAVEADPYMLQELEKTLSTETIKGSRVPLFGSHGIEVHIVAKALQNDPDVNSVSWKSSTSHVGRSSIVNNDGGSGTIWDNRNDMEYRDELTVPATTIDKVLENEVRPVPFLKLDLEGADILSLFGAEKVLSRKRPVVAYENSVHAPEVHGFTIEEFSAYLERLNYTPLDFSGRRVRPQHWFGFFEAWLAPNDQADWLCKELQSALLRQRKRLLIDIPVEVKTEEKTQPTQTFTDAGEGTPALDVDGGASASDFYMIVAQRLWSNPVRSDQPVEKELGETDWTVHGPKFADRILSVLRKLETEDLLMSKRAENEEGTTSGRQWMLDSGRMAWLLWLYARRSQNDRDEATEKKLWEEQSDAYRDYVRSTLHDLKADDILFAQGRSDAA